MSGAVAAELPAPPDNRFFRFALAKLLQILAQDALIYGLFILLVAQHESGFVTGLFVVTAILPSVILSVPGGVAGDSLPVKLNLVLTMAARLLLVWFLIDRDLGVSTLMAAALGWWTISQFFGPAESAALPSLVDSRRIASSNAILEAISLVARLAGAGLIAPLILKALDADGLFVVVLLLLFISLLLYVAIPSLTPSVRSAKRGVSWWSAMPEGLRTIRADPELVRVTTLRILLDTGLTVVVVAAPTFIHDVLRTAPENSIYIFAPGAIGLALGLVVAPVALNVVPPRIVATVGFGLLVGVVLTLPFIRDVAANLDDRTFLPLQRTEDLLNVRREIAATVLLLPFGGFGISLVRIAARTAVYRQSPPHAVAQVFATQSAIGSIISPVPILVAGLLVDWLEIRVFLLLTGSIMAAGALLEAFMPNRMLRAVKQVERIPQREDRSR